MGGPWQAGLKHLPTYAESDAGDGLAIRTLCTPVLCCSSHWGVWEKQLWEDLTGQGYSTHYYVYSLSLEKARLG